MTAAWNANTDEVTVGYRLYWENQPQGGSDGAYAFSADVGASTSHQVSLLPGSTYYFVVTAYDSSGQEGPPSSEALVEIPNEPPTLTNPGRQTSAMGDNISLQLLASDPNGDPLTYMVTGLPPSLTIDPSTGRISGVVSSAAGRFTVTATVSDGAAQDRETFEWVIAPVGILTGPLGALP